MEQQNLISSLNCIFDKKKDMFELVLNGKPTGRAYSSIMLMSACTDINNKIKHLVESCPKK